MLQGTMTVDAFWARDAILEVRAWRLKDWTISFIHIPWEKNNTADCLARKASQEGTAQRNWGQPPSFIYASMYLDARA